MWDVSYDDVLSPYSPLEPSLVSGLVSDQVVGPPSNYIKPNSRPHPPQTVSQFRGLYPLTMSAPFIDIPQSPVSGHARDFLDEFNRVAADPNLGASLDQLKKGAREFAAKPAGSLLV